MNHTPIRFCFSAGVARLLAISGLCVLLSLQGQAQSIRYVKPTASGNGNGTSWNNASSDLQAMINTTGVTQVLALPPGSISPAAMPTPSAAFTLMNMIELFISDSLTATTMSVSYGEAFRRFMTMKISIPMREVTRLNDVLYVNRDLEPIANRSQSYRWERPINCLYKTVEPSNISVNLPKL